MMWDVHPSNLTPLIDLKRTAHHVTMDSILCGIIPERLEGMHPRGIEIALDNTSPVAQTGTVFAPLIVCCFADKLHGDIMRMYIGMTMNACYMREHRDT